MRERQQLVTSNLKLARRIWGKLPHRSLETLKDLTVRHALLISSGHLTLLEGRWYVTHSGLLELSSRHHCSGIQVQHILKLSDPAVSRWTFKATVYKSSKCRGFIGWGDADPSNVSPLVHGAEMRIAETRAVNRALRKAYGIGICSVEEIGARSEPINNGQPKKRPPQPTNGNGFASPARLRDRLCQLIRQHRLDAALVKSYAIDFCRVAALKDAKREQVEAFVEHLSGWAAKDRDALLCQLNSYQAPEQGAA